MLIMITGLPGSGKSTFATALALSLKVPHLNTDIIRSNLGKRGQYDESTKAMIYAKMLKKTESILHDGDSVIVDATFYKEGLRKPYRALAKKYKKPIFWIIVAAEEAIIRERVSKKRQYSEADFEVYLAIKDAFEPLEDRHLVLRSDQCSVIEMVEKARAYLTLKPLGMTS